MRIAIFLLTAIGMAMASAAGTGEVIRTASELAAATYDRSEIGRPFDICARLTAGCEPNKQCSFAIEDKTGAMVLHTTYTPWSNVFASVGARIRATGHVNLGTRSRRAYALCTRLQILERGTPPKPTPVTAKEFLSGRFDAKPVTIKGIVRDIIADEIDRRYAYIVLTADGESISMPRSANDPILRTLAVGSTVEATGVCMPALLGARRQLGRSLQTPKDGIRILVNATDDPFDVPEISDSSRPRPQDIAALGRRKAFGRITAAWNGAALLKTDDGRIIGIENTEGAMPHYGDYVEAVGFPESNLYHVNLSRVIWRKLARPAVPDEDPVETSAAKLQTAPDGRRQFAPYIHGHAVRLVGTVLNMPDEEDPNRRFNLQCGQFVVPVDITDTPITAEGLDVGCEVAVTGTCIMECENWRPNAPFPTIRGFFLVVRKPADIAVLARPSWWTPSRLAIAVGALLIILIGSLAWNVLLRQLVERRGRELAQSAIVKAEADLKVYERTRLAVELHDSISQYLTGVSLAIRAAARFVGVDEGNLRRNLSLAAASLDSCRQELKNCLWDLRNLTLDEADLNDAIRKTLTPHLGDAELVVRFNVPRERFSDNTAHAILHILRELATNAIRHGNATRIKVAGSVEGDKLLFSVRDNGCGFDPDSCLGMNEGHFGLQGIRERINQFEGDMSVRSAPSQGTKVTITLHMPGEELRV